MRDKWWKRLKTAGSRSLQNLQISHSGSTKSFLRAQAQPVQSTSTNQMASPRGLEPRDLWSGALKALPDRDQQVITIIHATTAATQPLSQSMNELVRVTKVKQEECKSTGYKFRFREKDILLDDIAEKIVIWLYRFKDIGDIAVNFDPVHPYETVKSNRNRRFIQS